MIRQPTQSLTAAALFACTVWLTLGGCTLPDELHEEDTTYDDDGDDDDVVEMRGLVYYEAEPNNSLAQANPLVLGEDHKGSLSASDTVDYWKFEIQARTYINVFLGEIPAGSDYDLELIKDGVTIRSFTATSNKDELGVKLDVDKGSYALRVKAYSNPQAGKLYRVRAAYTAISRAREWVDVSMPYCRQTNGKNDSYCNKLCTRPAKPEWDVYRSDCSGYVSWAWGLAAAGLTTSQLGAQSSPFSTIKVTDLQPGDILVHASADNGHTFLFKRWVDKAARRILILEEFDCKSVAMEREIVLSTVSATNTATSLQGDGRAYTAMRYRMP